MHLLEMMRPAEDAQCDCPSFTTCSIAPHVRALMAQRIIEVAVELEHRHLGRRRIRRAECRENVIKAVIVTQGLHPRCKRVVAEYVLDVMHYILDHRGL